MRKISYFTLLPLSFVIVGCPFDMNGADMMNGGEMMDGTTEAKSFSATLSGGAEVPPVESGASGSATFELNEAGTELSYTVTVNDGVGVTQAHIHIGAADANGSIVAFLFGLVSGFDVTGELASGTITSDDVTDMDLGDLVDELRSGNAYVNVHSDANPSGEIRGQISPDSE